jgi:hypothetical protein
MGIYVKKTEKIDVLEKTIKDGYRELCLFLKLSSKPGLMRILQSTIP